MAEISSSRIVITVLGKNRPGIVAGVTRVLGEANVDIRDITQSIIEDIFTMTMLADTAESKLDFAELQKALAEAASFRASTCPSSARTSSTLCTACSEQAVREQAGASAPKHAAPTRPREERAWLTTPRKSTTASMTI